MPEVEGTGAGGSEEGGGEGGDGGAGGGGGAGGAGGNEELARVLEEVEQLREENTALAEQNRELLGGVSDGELSAELASERAGRVALEKRVEDMERKGAVAAERAAILEGQPELKGHLDLIGEDDPAKMRERAGKLKAFGEDRLSATRAAVEKEVAEKFGVPLGSSAEGTAAPEEVEARRKAVDSGDASAVAGQIVEKDLEKLM